MEEESGIGKLRLIQKFDTTYHIYNEDGWVLKETFWYEMTTQDTGRAVPQSSEGISEVKWISKADIPAMLEQSYASIRDLVQKVLATGYISSGSLPA